MNIPARTLLGFLGVMALIVGFFLMLTGAGIIKIEKITVEQSKKTMVVGVVLILIGIGGLWGEITPISNKPLPPIPSLPESGPATHTSEEGFDFALQGCEQGKRKEVACNINITSKGTDKTLQIWAVESRIFDNFNNEYIGNNVQLADKTNSSNVKTLLVANIPTKSIISFVGVSPDATSIARFDFRCNNVTEGSEREGSERIEMQFRNIPIKNQNNAGEMKEIN